MIWPEWNRNTGMTGHLCFLLYTYAVPDMLISHSFQILKFSSPHVILPKHTPCACNKSVLKCFMVICQSLLPVKDISAVSRWRRSIFFYVILNSPTTKHTPAANTCTHTSTWDMKAEYMCTRPSKWVRFVSIPIQTLSISVPSSKLWFLFTSFLSRFILVWYCIKFPKF